MPYSRYIAILLFSLLLYGCSIQPDELPASPTRTSLPSPAFTPTPPARATVTPAPPVPTATASPTPQRQPGILSKEALPCSLQESFTRCVDDLLGIEFEYPPAWGAIESVLRTGGYSGYAYDYFFDGKTIADTEPLLAGGRSRDFSEGRGAYSSDFAGFGESGLQSKPCNLGVLYPVCQVKDDHLAWMLRFPGATWLCESAPGYYTLPIFRIELDLPDNPTINGFVFEAPFLSVPLSEKLKDVQKMILGMDADSTPTRCDPASRQAYDTELQKIIERILARQVDGDTQTTLDELTHLVESIEFR